MADRRVFVLCGLRMRSAVELHLPEAAADEWDVDVEWGPEVDGSSEPPDGDLVAEYPLPDGGWWYRATATDAGYHLRFRDCGDVLITSDVTRVVVRPDPGGRSELLPVLMAGTIAAFLLTLRGATILHASAVSVGGTALAFVGQSGRGKTTLAAVMSASGAQLVSDDVLRVDPGSPVTCVGGATELRLRPAAAELAETPGASMRTTVDDRVALTFGAPTIERLPLGAIVVPLPSRTASDVTIELLSPSTALCAFLAFPRVYGWCRPDVLQRDFDVLSAVVNGVRVYTATIPWGPPFTADVPTALAGLVSDHPPSAQVSDSTTALR